MRDQRAKRIVFVSTFTLKEAEEERQIPFLKPHYVFNVEQISGLPARYYAQEPLPRHDHASELLSLLATKIAVRHGGTQAYYSPADDYIQLPHQEHFVSLEGYQTTAFHEHVHSTGHPSRLNREFGKRFGDQQYAAEELTAEIGASMLASEHGLLAELHHVDYIGSWIQLLKDHKKAILTAASQASRAVEFLLGRSLITSTEGDEKRGKTIKS